LEEEKERFNTEVAKFDAHLASHWEKLKVIQNLKTEFKKAIGNESALFIIKAESLDLIPKVANEIFYVCDGSNNCIQIFDDEGAFIRTGNSRMFNLIIPEESR
jgi:hypothetical protein